LLHGLDVQLHHAHGGRPGPGHLGAGEPDLAAGGSGRRRSVSPSRAVLITGISSMSGLSSGTGRATALRLHRAGWPVYATGRNLDGLKDLAEEGITTLRVDVTDEESMAAAVKLITEEHGAVGVLINNAAYSLNGTIGETPLDQVRRQFETNF